MLICSVFLVLNSCGENTSTSNTPEHVCVFDKQNASSAYQAGDATCNKKAIFYYSCSCGSKGNKTFEFGEVLGHSYVEGTENYYCQKCNASDCDGFTLKTAIYNDESCYVITNATKEAVVNGKLEIPRKYKGLPIRGIMSWSFSATAKEVNTLIIHDNIKNICDYLWNGTSIWDSDMYATSNLETIIFDSTCSDMRIESNAFYNCYKLSNINLAKGMIKYIPSDDVTTLDGGNSEYLFKGTPFFESLKDVDSLYYAADLLLHADPLSIGSNIVILDDTVAINAATFMNLSSLKSITIPSSVITIGDKVFYGCTNLETIIFDGTVAEFEQITIGESAFSGLKAKKIICDDGEVHGYYGTNGWHYNIGE